MDLRSNDEMKSPSMPGRKAVLLFTSTMTVMDGATISPALPEIQAAFKEIPNIEILVPLVLTVTALIIAACAPIAGLIIDWFGRKKLLLAVLVLYGLSGSSGLYLDSIWGLIMGRAVLGMAVAGVMTCTTTLVADYFIGPERQKFIGIQVAFMNFGGVVFIVAGGFLADLNWRAPFAIYLISFFIVPWVYLQIVETRPSDKRVRDIQISSKKAIPWPNILLLYALGLIGWMVFYIILLKVPFYLKELTGASATQIGIATGYWSFVGAIISAQYRRFRRHWPYQTFFAVLFLIAGLGFWVLAFAKDYWVVMIAMTLCGFGFGLLMPNINVWLAEVAPEHVRGRLMGGMTTCNFLGQFLSPLAFQPVIAISGLAGILGGFSVAGFLTIFMGLGFFLWMILSKKDSSPI